MSLLGVDVGTTGCKASLFSERGNLLASAYQEYDILRPRQGWAELDPMGVWEKVKNAIREVVATPAGRRIRALAVSSLGEAMVPVTNDRRVLGPSLLHFDTRGQEYLEALDHSLGNERVYQINGNTLGNHYSLTKLMWTREHEPAVYEGAHKFLLWGSFVSFMLGAEPVSDYSLANRTLLFDIGREEWSREILAVGGLDAEKLPGIAPSGTVIGKVSGSVARDLGLRSTVLIVAGAHDQCANAVGCGAVEEGHAVYGMGTFICITPVYMERREPSKMIERGLNTEHHAVPGRFVSFIYNQGGSLVKWFRDTFAWAEHIQAQIEGRDIYADLFAELPVAPSGVVVLPHFETTGPPAFVSDSCGVIAGLRLNSSRGDILKGILEGATFYLKLCVDSLPPTGLDIVEFRVVGGGSKSDEWVQLSADIMGRPFMRPQITEAGTLGAAIIAGVGAGEFSSLEESVAVMVRPGRHFTPNRGNHRMYQDRLEIYGRLWPLMREYLGDLMSNEK